MSWVEIGVQWSTPTMSADWTAWLVATSRYFRASAWLALLAETARSEPPRNTG
jgi:hypothetical protein